MTKKKAGDRFLVSFNEIKKLYPKMKDSDAIKLTKAMLEEKVSAEKKAGGSTDTINWPFVCSDDDDEGRRVDADHIDDDEGEGF